MGITKLFKEQLRNYRWNKVFHDYERNNEVEKLKLIIGPARSGTTWVANTLSKTKTPIVYLEEPLYQILPRIKFTRFSDHTSVMFKKRLPKRFRLFTAYKVFTSEQFARKNQNEIYLKVVKDNPNKVLVKEVHSILATHLLHLNLKCDIILLSRDIKTTIDSLIYAQGYDSLFFQNEFLYVRNRKLLAFIGYRSNIIKKLFHLHQQISENKDSQLKIVGEKAFTLCVVNAYFQILSKRFSRIKHFSYEEIIQNPDTKFLEMSDFFGMDYVRDQHRFLKSTSNEKVYDLKRSESEIYDRGYKHLNNDEVNFIDSIIDEYKEITK